MAGVAAGVAAGFAGWVSRGMVVVWVVRVRQKWDFLSLSALADTWVKGRYAGAKSHSEIRVAGQLPLLCV